MMKSIKLLCIIAVLAITGLSMTACDLFGGDEGENSFEGTWNGSVTKDGIEYDDGKLVFTETGWTFTSGKAAINESGSYTPSGSSATLKVKGGFTFGTAYILLSNLTLSVSAGDLAGVNGSFAKEGGKNSFVGKWEGSISNEDGEVVTTKDATIEFTVNTWTLIAGGVTETGSYTVNLIGNAILKKGGSDFGTASIFLGSLTIIAADGGDFEGNEGKFVKEGSKQDPTSFIGTWTGSITKDDATMDATLTFNESGSTWTLSSSQVNANGTYEISGATATLKVQGGFRFGSAYILLKKLTLSISGGDHAGVTGSFTKN